MIVGGVEQLKRRRHCRSGDRIATVGAGPHGGLLGCPHDLGAAHHGGDGEAGADCLAHSGEVRLQASLRSGKAATEAEAHQHLVGNDEGTMTACQVTDMGRDTPGGLDHPALGEHRL